MTDQYFFHVNLFAHPFACTWEQAAANLESLPRMIFEPDGSFVVSGGIGADRWQVDGHLFDFEDRLYRVELRGNCPRVAMDQLLACVDWPQTQITFEMVREGVTLSEAEFRRSVMVEDDAAHTPAASRVVLDPDCNKHVPDPECGHTTWHITFGTYGTRLHGDTRPTVDKRHNQFGESFLAPDEKRQQAALNRMKHPAVILSLLQREFIERQLPQICKRGGWQFRTCAAAADHVHLLCDIPTDIHGEKVRRLVKRWLTQSLDQCWPLAEDARWWATEGSNKAIHDASYRKNAFYYIERQRTLR